MEDLYFDGLQKALELHQYKGVRAKAVEVVDPNIGDIDAQVIVESGEITLQHILPKDSIVVQTNCGSQLAIDTVIQGPAIILIEIKASFNMPSVVKWSTKTRCFNTFLNQHPEFAHFKKYVMVLFDGGNGYSSTIDRLPCTVRTPKRQYTFREAHAQFWQSYTALFTPLEKILCNGHKN
ncbi:hypothetical protein Pelo_3544 [Pelomyxa schiedti]|nr:hypothetical protein Pelo_3544 [Pelomyxa schiedti]